MTRATDVVGYTFNADVYCPDDTVKMFGAMCDGIAQCPGHQLQNRDGAAYIACCYEESSYDSSVYPKVMFASDVEGPDRCGNCGEYLVGEASDYENEGEE